MRVFGITGGSGSGKSTVSAMLADMGAEIIDTDKIARAVTEKGSECLKELCGAFGNEILLADGSLDRKKLAGIAFDDKEKTALLSRITHKYIKAETKWLIESSTAELIGIDGAVIIGSPVEPLCERMVCVTADRDTRLSRIISRDGISAEAAEKRLSAQPDEEFYRKHSDYLIYNGSDYAPLWEQTAELYNKLRGENY